MIDELRISLAKLPPGLVGNRRAEMRASVEIEWLRAQLMQAFDIPVVRCEFKKATGTPPHLLAEDILQRHFDMTALKCGIGGQARQVIEELIGTRLVQHPRPSRPWHRHSQRDFRGMWRIRFWMGCCDPCMAR
jgi:hypothetical protein